VCGDRTRATSLKHKKFTSMLQQEYVFHVRGAGRPESCTVNRSATLPLSSDSRTFYSKQESRMALSSNIFVSFSDKVTTSKIFVVSFLTTCVYICRSIQLRGFVVRYTTAPSERQHITAALSHQGGSDVWGSHEAQSGCT
jgi:hypothetical protein